MVDPVQNILGLPGMFVSCVQCFEYIQFGRDFERDHERLVLRLDLLQTRLVQWGDYAGVVNALGELEFRDDLKGCERYLRNVMEQFQTAKERAVESKLAPNASKSDNDTLQEPNLREKIHAWTSKCSKKWKHGRETVQWALHNKNALEKLVCNIRDDIEELFKVFPKDQVNQQLAIRRENDVKNLEQGELERVKELAAQDDDLILKQAVEKELRSRSQGSHLYSGEFNFKTEKESRNRLGDDVAPGITRSGAGHVYAGKFTTSGPGTNSFGNNYMGGGGK